MTQTKAQTLHIKEQIIKHYMREYGLTRAQAEQKEAEGFIKAFKKMTGAR